MITALTIFSALFSQLFDRFEVPITSDSPHVLWVESGYDSTRDILIIDGYNVSLYENATQTGRTLIDIPQNSTAIDFADTNGDGRQDLIVIAGKQVIEYDLAQESVYEKKVLFETPSIFESHTGSPFSMVMVVQKDAQIVLAIPTQNELRIYDTTGEIIDRYPIGADAPYHATIGQPFQSTPLILNRAAPVGALEFTVQQTLAVKPELPQDWLPTTLSIPQLRQGTPTQLQDVASLNPNLWPWFPLENKSQTRRVSYAVEANPDPVTLITIQRQNTPISTDDTLRPAKRFAGHIIQPASAPPDFNNDGFSDFITWISPVPKPSINVVTKMIGGGTWPLSLQVHLFDPEKQLFSPKPGAVLKVNITLDTILQRGPELPLDNVILEDMTADNLCDIAFSLGGNQFYIWRNITQSFVQSNLIETAQPISGVPLHGNLDEKGNYAIVLHAGNQLHILSNRKVAN